MIGDEDGVHSEPAFDVPCRRVQRHSHCAGKDRSMTAWICATCGVQYPDTDQPPPGCPICSDERQYVGWDGQQWTTMPELARDHANEMREEEPDLIGLGVSPSFGIGQRALGSTEAENGSVRSCRRSDGTWLFPCPCTGGHRMTASYTWDVFSTL